MTRAQLEHVIRAAASIAEVDEILVLGSQAILGSFPDAPEELLRSNEADVCPLRHPDRWDLVDGSIGELSPFHKTFGYYAHGVEPGVAVLPDGWQARLVPVESPRTAGARGLCLEVHDLLISKYVAGRPKDLDFCAAALIHRLAQAETLRQRLGSTTLEPQMQSAVAARIERHASP